MHKLFFLFLLLVSSLFTYGQKVQSFNESWEFAKDIDSVFIAQLLGKKSDVKWEQVSLPHTASAWAAARAARAFDSTNCLTSIVTPTAQDRGAARVPRAAPSVGGYGGHFWAPI